MGRHSFPSESSPGPSRAERRYLGRHSFPSESSPGPSRGDRRYLALDEHVVCRVRRHPAVLARPFAEALGAIVLASFLGTLLSPSDGSDVIDTVLGLVAIFFMARFAWRGWEWSVARIVVTDRRLFEVSGLLSRRVASLPLTKVTDMTYHRSVPGRLLGYGDLRVESPGQKQAVEKIGYLPNPDDFYRTVTSLVMAKSPTHREDVATRVDTDNEDTGPLPRVIV
ncbi:MAG: PH domain-containing protein [Actinomycetota bacterium]|nr:PH domain-containing protein [Actinomycetota bacterium]